MAFLLTPPRPACESLDGCRLHAERARRYQRERDAARRELDEARCERAARSWLWAVALVGAGVWLGIMSAGGPVVAAGVMR